ncbi:MAG TPA: N-6 DNA methylase [Flavisolibacter sp.]|nr:N-6 DNA methylase [Flavisolibacter sp.]
MNKTVKEVIDRTWGNGKCDIPSVLHEIDQSKNKLNKDEVLEVFNTLFNKQGLSSTPNDLADLIYKISEVYAPKSVLDLCCGTGNILYNFKKQIVQGLDINPGVIDVAKKLNPDFDFVVADSLQHDFGKRKFDMVVGSLPFGLRTSNKLPIETELIQKGLSLLAKDGVAVFVVPEGLLCSQTNVQFRKQLLSSYAIDFIVSLPGGMFHPYSNIKTSIIVVRNGAPNKDIFMVEYNNNSAAIVEDFKQHKGEFFLPTSKLEDRLDRNYYSHIDIIEEKLRGKEVKKLSELAEIIRGQVIPKELLDTKGEYAVFNRKDNSGNQLYVDSTKSTSLILKPKDIVIPLIGGNKLYVHDGNKQQTIIPENYAIIRSARNNYISTYLQSKDGQELLWQQTDRLSVGSAIRHLSIASLQNIVIPILPLSDLRFLDEDYLKNASLENLRHLESHLQQLIGEYQSEKLHLNFTKEILTIVKAQEDRTKRIEEKIDVVNIKLDNVLNTLNNHILEIKQYKRDDEEKLSRICFEIDEKLTELIKEQSKNLSFYENEIKKWLDDWSMLHTSSSNFLTSAELIFDHLPQTENTDYSPFIIQYCRALENEILKKLFEAYHIHLVGTAVDRKTLIAADITNEKTGMFAKFIDKDRRDYTLGNMSTIMSFLKEGGNTLKNSPLLQSFRAFTLTYFEEKVVQKDFLDTINNITSNYRNKSAHPYILTLEIAQECQKLIRRILSEFLSNYKGSIIASK